jgi:hypothetical protein
MDQSESAETVTDDPKPVVRAQSETVKRKKSDIMTSFIRQTSMPELSGRKDKLMMESGERPHEPPQSFLANFARAGSSAEDETVGAIRTRVMNSLFVKQRSLGHMDAASKGDPRGRLSAMRSMSMPSHVMKQVR